MVMALPQQLKILGWVREHISILLRAALVSLTMLIATSASARVFSDKGYGYLFEYPDSWRGVIYRSGVELSRVSSPVGGCEFQVRLYISSQEQGLYVQTYIHDVKWNYKANLLTRHSGSSNGVDYVELEFDGKRNGEPFYLYHRLLFFPDQSRVMVAVAGCDKKWESVEAPVIRKIGDSLWVYNVKKLSSPSGTP